MYISFVCFGDFIAHSFLSVDNIPLYGCTTVCLSIHLLKDTFVASKFLWLLRISQNMSGYHCTHSLLSKFPCLTDLASVCPSQLPRIVLLSLCHSICSCLRVIGPAAPTTGMSALGYAPGPLLRQISVHVPVLSEAFPVPNPKLPLGCPLWQHLSFCSFLTT